MKILFKNAAVITGDASYLENADVAVDGAFISYVGNNCEWDSDRVIDCG